MIPMRGAGRDQQMREEEIISEAEANIRDDYRNGVIDQKRFLIEMHIVARARVEARKAKT